MRSYEIHTVKEGAWKIDSVFDDRDLALHEATKIDEGSRYSGVRVIEENYDETSNLTTTRTIFRGRKAAEKKKAASGAPSRPKRQASHGSRGSAKTGRRRPPPQKKQSSFLVPVLILLIILFGGLAAMLLLQQIA